MKRKKTVLLFLTALISASIAVSASGNDLRYSHTLDIVPGKDFIISMVTVFPGQDVYSLFGHSSFRVLDPENSIDWMYNYGTFDFSDPLFVPKFISGQLNYYLDVTRFQASLSFYSSVEDRTVVEQILDLDYREKVRLFNFLQHNARPENRFYKYDFIKDNCSTRIADALDYSYGSSFTDYTSYTAPDKSFRQLIREYLKERPYTDFGIQLLLGSGADRIPADSEIFFLPLPLMDAFDAALRQPGSRPGDQLPVSQAADSTGAKPAAQIEMQPEGLPLVAGTQVLYRSSGNPSSVPNRPLLLFTLLLAVYAVTLRLIRYFTSRKKRKRRFQIIRTALSMSKALCETAFLLFSGIAGSIIFYLWFLSDHSVTKLNYNLLWCSPLSLLLFALYASGRLRKTAVLLSWLKFGMCAAFIAVTAAGVQAAHPAAWPLVLALMLTVFGRFYSPVSGKLNIKGYWKIIPGRDI